MQIVIRAGDELRVLGLGAAGDMRVGACSKTRLVLANSKRMAFAKLAPSGTGLGDRDRHLRAAGTGCAGQRGEGDSAKVADGSCAMTG